MKCSVCASEIAEGSTHCGFCGQPVRQETSFPGVSEHWNAVEKDIESYEAERKKRTASIRKHCRRIRIRWVLMALAVAFALWFFMANEEGKALRSDSEAYMNAWWTYQQGDYRLAYEQFSLLDEYFMNTRGYKENCRQHILGQEYDYALSVYNAGRYEEALDLFYALGEYGDSAGMIDACLNLIRENLEEPALEWNFNQNPEEAAETPWSGKAEWKRVVDSKIRYAALFNGKTSLYPEGNPDLSGDWTFTMMLGFRSEEDMAIFSVYNEELERTYFQLELKDRRLQWTVLDDDSCFVTMQGGTEIELGRKWYYVAITREGDSMRLYVDGILEAEITEEIQLTLQGTEQILLGGISNGWVVLGEEKPGAYQGYISNVSYYDDCFTNLEMTMLYEPREYLATHLWDTSYYFLPEDLENQDRFVFFQTEEYGHHMCLAMINTVEPDDDLGLYWNSSYNRIEFTKSSLVESYDLYYLDGETWVYVQTYTGFSCIYDVVAVTSSDLYVSGDDGYELLPVILGGRG